jgi:hypothetical protein
MALLLGPLPFSLLGWGMTVFDVAGVVAAVAMILLLLVGSGGNLRRLAELDPPGRRRE